MTETPQAEGGNGAVQQAVSIHNIYLKDASFESPNTPAIFSEMQQPNVQVNLGVNTGQVGQDAYEVVLNITVTAKGAEDKTAFLVEIQQAGVFTLSGFSDSDLGAVLGIYCPNVLFPYARETVSSLISKGGYPPLLLDPVNFEAMYAEHMQRQSQQAGA